MAWPRVIFGARNPPGNPGDGTGVYTDLDELIRLRHKARGFSLRPRQPLHSALAGRKGQVRYLPPFEAVDG